MTVTTAGSRSWTTPTTSSLACARGAGEATGSAPSLWLGVTVAAGEIAGADPPTRYVATAPPETPPTMTPASTRAAARAPLTSGSAPREAGGFGRRARRRAAAARGGADRLGLDHLADSGRADLEIDVGVGLDVHIPTAGDLELLVHALEALLRVRDRVDRFGRDLARRIDRERDVEVPGLAVDGDLGDVADLDRLACGRLACPDGDHVHRVRLCEQAHVARAHKAQRDPFLTVVAKAVANPGREPFVRDPHVLPDTQPGDRRERTGGRLEDQAHRARLALRRELVVIGVEDHRLRLPHAEAVLEERAPRHVVVEQLREAALARTHGLVDGLGLLLGRLPDENLPGL